MEQKNLTLEEKRKLWQHSFDLCDKILAENKAKKDEENKAYIEAYQNGLREDFTRSRLMILISQLKIERVLEVLIFNCGYDKEEYKKYSSIGKSEHGELLEFEIKLMKYVNNLFPL